MDPLHPQTQPEPVSWQARLSEAITTEDVLWAVKDFLAQWTPEEIARLPQECRPSRITDADDVTLYAFRLVQQQFASDEGAVELNRMAAFLASASHRITQILARARDSRQDTSFV